MIEINLIPSHLRKKDSRSSGALDFFNLPKEFVLGCISIFILVIALAHIILFGMWSAKSAQYALTNAQWQRLSADRNSLDAIQKEIKDLKTKTTLLTGTVMEDQITWSQKLNILSDMLPKGVWFKKIDMNNYVLTIDGYVYSRAHDEITIVGNFVSNLKKDKNFMKDFTSLELKSITRSKRGEMEVADFSLTAKVRHKIEPVVSKAKAK